MILPIDTISQYLNITIEEPHENKVISFSDNILKLIPNKSSLIQFPHFEYSTLNNFNRMLKTLERIVNKYGKINVSIVTNMFSDKTLNSNNPQAVLNELLSTTNTFQNPIHEKVCDLYQKFGYHCLSHENFVEDFLYTLNPKFYKIQFYFRRPTSPVVTYILTTLSFKLNRPYLEVYLDELNKGNPIPYDKFVEVVDNIGLDRFKQLNKFFKSHCNLKMINYFTRTHPDYLIDKTVDDVYLNYRNDKIKYPCYIENLLVFLSPKEILSSSKKEIVYDIFLESMYMFTGLKSEEENLKFLATLNEHVILLNERQMRMNYLVFKFKVALQLNYFFNKLHWKQDDSYFNLVKMYCTLVENNNYNVYLCWNSLANRDSNDLANYLLRLNYLISNKFLNPSIFKNIQDTIPYDIQSRLNLITTYIKIKQLDTV